MSMELIAIISVGVTMLGVSAALASLIITGQNGLRAEMREQRKEMQEQRKETQVEFKAVREEIKEQGQKHSKEITEVKNGLEEVKNDLTKVKIEVAALKATVDTYFRVRVDPPQQAAVAEPPEDYGAD